MLDADSGNRNETAVAAEGDVAPAAEVGAAAAAETAPDDSVESEESASGTLGKMDAASAAETVRSQVG